LGEFTATEGRTSESYLLRVIDLVAKIVHHAAREGCEEQAWEEGRLMVFDDSIEHEAWNDSDAERIVLLFEIWRPELDERERAEVSALLALSGQYAE